MAVKILQWENAKQNQEKAHGVKSRANQVQASQSSLPVKWPRKTLIPYATRSTTTRVNGGLSGPLTRNPMPRILIGGLATASPPLPGTYQDSQRPEGRQVVTVNHTFAQFRHSEPFLDGNGGNTPETQVPRCQPRASLASTGLRVVVPGLLCSFFSAQGLSKEGPWAGWNVYGLAAILTCHQFSCLANNFPK